jgi:hypothetical protein
MKELKLLVCAMALASLALFTGCGGDDNGDGSNQPTGTNAPASLASSSIVLTPSDGAGDHTVVTDAGDGYSATFNDGATEAGTFAYTPSGDNATLVLTPNDGSANSNINLTFTSTTAGTYTSDTVGSGTFTVTSQGGTP